METLDIKDILNTNNSDKNAANFSHKSLQNYELLIDLLISITKDPIPFILLAIKLKNLKLDINNPIYMKNDKRCIAMAKKTNERCKKFKCCGFDKCYSHLDSDEKSMKDKLKYERQKKPAKASK
ncbi:uncharacterized protein KGF55_003822 [Candida pseudojiufengensis]|uniref:uncharacterized protein n=1 Tax=Candida pseudojiufengensis TaxID=497109 RepID=UPI0022245058|nr:uncharacterized protein KGF55_003822 [Candida pseudojiufengensis]KAI5961851.1 hypothetical protein KGF55_003822 [Candida pseudojiufengensis]